MNDLLDLVVRAHGGLERWRQVNTLDVRLSLAGALYRIKGDFQGIVDVNMKIAVERPFLSLTPYPRPDLRGLFTPERVWIEDMAGTLVEEREKPHASFSGHILQTPWDNLHRLYFTSYAM